MRAHVKEAERAATRKVWFPVSGAAEASVLVFAQLEINKRYSGPAMVESPFSTVVIDPESIFWRLQDGSLVIDTQIKGDAACP